MYYCTAGGYEVGVRLTKMRLVDAGGEGENCE